MKGPQSPENKNGFSHSKEFDICMTKTSPVRTLNRLRKDFATRVKIQIPGFHLEVVRLNKDCLAARTYVAYRSSGWTNNNRFWIGTSRRSTTVLSGHTRAIKRHTQAGSYFRENKKLISPFEITPVVRKARCNYTRINLTYPGKSDH